ncbi:ABC transporter ATP-binding protein [Paenochrobactrum sp. BZR 588]|uniref:ABC transporter ATP-binding protein n=1 Tax=unclassified Paenochrobactrum TaxID=2639760 RepID=UPI0038550391
MTLDLLQVRNISKHYTVSKSLITRHKQVLRAVDDVSFSIKKGETLALVGESGCGKSTTARLVMRLIELTGGSVYYEGTDLVELSPGALRRFRQHMQIIFQDPYASLNPRMTVAQTLEEPMIINDLASSAYRKSRVEEVLAQVGLSGGHAHRFPHEFSGGQRQRVNIARALMLQPSLVICDEPVSALDVSIQAQIINLLSSLQEQLGLSFLFISHDLAVVKHIADRVAVMYLGKIVEIADKKDFFITPRHPYSRALLSAIPSPNPKNRLARLPLSGEIPNPINIPSGCHFHPRCPYSQELCRTIIPTLKPTHSGTSVACHLVDNLPAWKSAEKHVSPFSACAQKRLSVYAAKTTSNNMSNSSTT